MEGPAVAAGPDGLFIFNLVSHEETVSCNFRSASVSRMYADHRG